MGRVRALECQCHLCATVVVESNQVGQIEIEQQVAIYYQKGLIEEAGEIVNCARRAT